MKYRKVGLVLGGGGGKGSYQIGVYKYLKERGLTERISYISANSIGALNLTLLANQNVEEAEKIWCSLKRSKVLTFKPFKQYLDFENFSIFSRQGMLDIFKDEVDLKSVAKSPVGLYVAAYDEDDKKNKFFQLNNESVERIINIILASSAIPKVFSSVLIDSHHYSDGFVSENVPVNILIEQGCDLIFVIPLSAHQAPTPTMYPNVTIIDFNSELFQKMSRWKGTLGFDHELAKERIEQGYANAQELINYLDSIGLFAETYLQRIKYWWRRKIGKERPYLKYYSLKTLPRLIRQQEIYQQMFVKK